MLRDAQENSQGNIGATIALCCIRCLCAVLLDIIEFINDIALAQVSIFGKAYVAGKVASGWSLIRPAH